MTTELLDHWLGAYRRAMGVPYTAGTEPHNLHLCTQLLANLDGQIGLAKRAMTALLSDPALAWVNSKNLDWLAKGNNLTYIMPVLRRAAATTASEWTGGRSSGPSTTKVTRRT